MLFFISFKGRSALACFPFEGEDFSWNVRYDPQTREGDAEEDQEQPAAVGWSFFSSHGPKFLDISFQPQLRTRRGRSSGRRHASAKCIVTG